MARRHRTCIAQVAVTDMMAPIRPARGDGLQQLCGYTAQAILGMRDPSERGPLTLVGATRRIRGDDSTRYAANIFKTVRLQHALRDVIINFIFAARTARREKGPR